MASVVVLYYADESIATGDMDHLSVDEGVDGLAVLVAEHILLLCRLHRLVADILVKVHGNLRIAGDRAGVAIDTSQLVVRNLIRSGGGI